MRQSKRLLHVLLHEAINGIGKRKSKTPGALAFGGFTCVKGEFFGIAIADLTSVIKSIYNISCFLLTVYNYIAKE